MSTGLRQSTLERITTIREFIEALREYWPLTLRGIHYHLVDRLPGYKNTRREYQNLSVLLTKAREEELVLWDAMEDRSRSELVPVAYEDAREFIQAESEYFLAGYQRNLLQSQPQALELWIEKDALLHLAGRITNPFGIRAVAGRGFTSADYRHKLCERVKRNWSRRHQRTHILYFGDLDPSGRAMLPAMLDRLQNKMGLGDLITGTTCALTVEQVRKHDLPHSIDAIKPRDPRTPGYIAWLRNIGEDPTLAVELDALGPATLQNLVRETVEANLDLSAFEVERRRERRELPRLRGLRRQALEALGLGG